MKRIIITLAIVSCFSHIVAQSTEDALRYSFNRLSGTARNLSLGGAMGALGGDFSSILNNPAGIAVYRSSEFTFTPSISFNQTDTEFYGVGTRDDKINVPFQQIAFIGTFKPMRESTNGIVSTHFGIGYNRTNSFTRNTFIQATGLMSSLLDEFVDQGNNNNWDPYYNELAYEKYLIRQNPFEGYENQYLHDFEYVGETPEDYYFGAAQGLNQSRLLTEKGSSGEFNLSGGANFNNVFYFGGSFGITTLNYEKRLTHFEEVNGGWQNLTNDYIYYRALDGWEARENFIFKESVNTTGLGINLKVGVIYKPVNSLRIGVSLHTPTFYSMDEEFSTSVESNYIELGMEEGNAVMYDQTGSDFKEEYGEFSYNLRTPFKTIGSLAYVFGNLGFISVDYEYTNYTSMKYNSKTASLSEKQYLNYQNDLIKNTFRGTHNFNIGTEIKPNDVFSLRAGVNLIQSPYKEGHFKNSDKFRNYSAGLGYRFNNMIIDLGYILRHEKYGYSLYRVAPYLETGELENATITNNTHQFAVTVGWKF